MTAPSATQQEALSRLLAQQQDPASPNYHRWLTPAEYADRFGLSRADLNRITDWLKSQGFVVQSIGGGRNTVTFSGTAAQVQSAFQAEIHRYNVDGEEHFANSTPLMIPAALEGIVSGILGVNDFRMHPASRVWSNSGPKMRPDYYDGSFIFPNFLAPADVATIYDIPSTMDGTGQTIAIVGRSDIFLADINDFRSAFGLPTISAGNCTSNATGVITACNDPHFKYVLLLPSGQSDPGKPDSIAQDDVTEADLDVEWSGAVAPNAQVIYINSPSPAGRDVYDSLAYAISPPQGTPIPAPVVSMSFGLCELYGTALETELQQAASEGITVVNSTGDSGAAACDPIPASAIPYTPATNGLAVNYPASSPWVTAVGGTSISLADDSYPNPNPTYWNTSNGSNGGSAVRYIPELAWNDDETWAAYCQAPAAGDKFCSQGGSEPVTGWVALGTTATAAQVQQDIWIFSGGGGASNCYTQNGRGECTGGFPQPSWQQSLAVPNLPAAAAGVRWIPDVSLSASPNFPGYILCTPQNPDAGTPVYTSTCANGISGPNGAVEGFQSVIGGTSASAPVFAGIVALLNQYLAGPSSPGLGSVNPMLYALAQNNATNHAFNQTTGGDNLVYCVGGQPSTQPSNIQCPSTGPSAGVFGYSASNFDPTTGYNLATGLGSVDVKSLATAWAGSRTASSTSLTASPTATYQGASVTLTADVMPTTATGNVVFMNGSTTLGTAALSSGTATLTTSALPVATNSITATYNGNGLLMPSTSSAATVNVAPSFTLTVSLSVFQVTQGQSVNVPVTLTLASGFTGTVSFACQSPGSEITCTAPPATNVSGNVNFNIATTAPSAALQRPFERRIFYAALLPPLLGIGFTFGTHKGFRRGRRMLGLIVVLGFSMLWLGSCTGSSNNTIPGTPKGTYTINVSGTSGSLTVPASFQIAVR
jgi:subtilase family serine protease